GKPIPFVRITFIRPFAFMMMRPLPPEWGAPTALTDSLGRYRADVDTGTYVISATPWLATASLPQFLPEWYKDARTPDKATPVTVSEKDTVTVNFDLERIMPPVILSLRGTVNDTAGHPLKGAIVAVFRSLQDLHQAGPAAMAMTPADLGGTTIDGFGFCRGIVWIGLTDSLGRYQAKVPGGRPIIVGAVKRFYIPQFFDHKAGPDEADVLVLRNDTTGIDFALSLIPQINNSVAGSVLDSTGTGVPSHVLLIPVRPQRIPLVVRFAETDSTGAFRIANVRAGRYFALALPFDTYAPAFYKAGAFGVHHWRLADTIGVSGDITGINIGVVPVHMNGFATIQGRLLATSLVGKLQAGLPLAGVNVYLQDARGFIAGYGLTDNTGTFAAVNVAPGTYTLFVDKAGYSSPSGTVTVNPVDYTVTVPDITVSPEVSTSVGSEPTVAAEFRLDQNYPNPFNPATVIRYTLASPSKVTLTVYNLLGQEVGSLINAVQPAGAYQVRFDGTALASGIYFYRLSAGSFLEVKRMVLMK
ncbi:MAG TPA: carboxypeptidase regulatory-like domain-containing protein, partial [Desulfuromonadaceae bacterium]